jgi:hypothetical protein
MPHPNYPNIFNVGDICRYQGELVQVAEIKNGHWPQESSDKCDIVIKLVSIVTSRTIHIGVWAHNGDYSGNRDYDLKSSLLTKLEDGIPERFK